MDSEGPDQPAYTQSELGLPSPLTEALDTAEYRIRSNYRTVSLGFSKLLGKRFSTIFTLQGHTLKKD